MVAKGEPNLLAVESSHWLGYVVTFPAVVFLKFLR
jgi:hypothetical protein